MVRVSVLVAGTAEEPPSTGTTEYCTDLLWGFVRLLSGVGVKGRAWVKKATEESAKMAEIGVRRIAFVQRYVTLEEDHDPSSKCGL